MATPIQQSREDYLLTVEALILDNLNKEISAEDMRQVLLNLSESVFNKINEPRTGNPTARFYMNSDDTVSGLVGFKGNKTIDQATEILSGNLATVNGVVYQVSLDGVSWDYALAGDPTSDISDLQDWIDANITTEDFFVRTIAIYDTNEIGLSFVGFQYE